MASQKKTDIVQIGDRVLYTKDSNGASITTRSSHAHNRPLNISRLNPNATPFVPGLGLSNQVPTITSIASDVDPGEATNTKDVSSKADSTMEIDNGKKKDQNHRIPAPAEEQKCQYWDTGICLYDEAECGSDHPKSPSMSKSTVMHKTSRSESTLNTARNENQKPSQAKIADARNSHRTAANAKKEMGHHFAISICKYNDDECNGVHQWGPLTVFPPTSKFFGTPVMHTIQQGASESSSLLVDTRYTPATNTKEQDAVDTGSLLVDLQSTHGDESAQVGQPQRLPPGYELFNLGPKAPKKEVCQDWIRGNCTKSDAECPYSHEWIL